MAHNKIDQIYEAVQKVNQVYDLWAASHGLTSYEMQMYYAILKTEDTTITQKALCQKLDAPKTSINSIIKKHLKAGYIELHINPQNKREKIIFLTSSGRRFAADLIHPLFQYEEEAASGWFTALNDGKTSAILSFCRTIIFMVLPVLILPALLGMNGVWLSITAGEFLSIIMSLYYFRKYRSVWNEK